MARDRSHKPEISGGSTSSDDLLKDAWRSMGRTDTGDRVEDKNSPSTILAEAATSGQEARTETAEEIARMLRQESERRQPEPSPARAPEPQRRRQPPPPDRPAASRPRRTETQPPPPRRRPGPRPVPGQQPQQQQQRSSRRGLGWIVFAAFWLISSIVGVFFGDDGGSTPDIDVSIPATTIDFSDLVTTTISASPEATFVNIRDVSVGQCIESLPEGSIVNDVAVVPCDLPHQYELFGNTQVTADDFPGTEVFELATNACIPLFGNYVGEDYFDSLFYIESIAPTEEGWDIGDRAVNCLLYSWPDGAETVESVTGSAEGSGNTSS